ncbi:cation:proton antiporter [Dietzia lutea]|nr:monovalent cation/H(+) antiporter subunit G [Dietzia lutea]
MVTDAIAWLFLIAALIIFLSSAIGIFRVHSPYELLTIVTLVATAGLACAILSAIFFQPSPANILKGLAALVLQLITTSVGSSVAGRALHLRDSPVRTASEQREMGPGADPVEDF